MYDPNNLTPASEDPLGDPADQMQQVAPASEDPLGDPGMQDFLQRFGTDDYTDDEAYQHFGQLQSRPEFGQAVQDSLASMPPEQFQWQAQQAAQNMAPNDIGQLASNLLGSLQGRGMDVGQLLPMLGIGANSPDQFGVDDIARLLGWTQQNQPAALGDAAGGTPGLLQHLGNPVVRDILGNLADRFFNR
jgi:hypothetical protein